MIVKCTNFLQAIHVQEEKFIDSVAPCVLKPVILLQPVIVVDVLKVVSVQMVKWKTVMGHAVIAQVSCTHTYVCIHVHTQKY